MPRRRTRRRVQRRHHPQAQPAAAAAPVVVREAGRVERLAYTRTQAAEALGISRSTFNRRVLPSIETVDMPWGARLIPVDELERLLTERRRPPPGQAPPGARGRPPALPAEIVELIRAERAGGKTLGQIAQGLNASHTPTAHGGAMWWPSSVRAVLNRAADHPGLRQDTQRVDANDGVRQLSADHGRVRRSLTPSRPSPSATVPSMSEPLQVTIVYEPGDDGWIVASIPEVPGALSQGQTREEARTNVIDALHGILELRFGGHPEVSDGVDSEPLHLVIGA